jgi:hypothetical protein
VRAALLIDDRRMDKLSKLRAEVERQARVLIEDGIAHGAITAEAADRRRSDVADRLWNNVIASTVDAELEAAGMQESSARYAQAFAALQVHFEANFDLIMRERFFALPDIAAVATEAAPPMRPARAKPAPKPIAKAKPAPKPIAKAKPAPKPIAKAKAKAKAKPAAKAKAKAKPIAKAKAKPIAKAKAAPKRPAKAKRR